MIKIALITMYNPRNTDIINVRRVSEFFDFVVLIDNSSIDSPPTGGYCSVENIILVSNFNFGGLSGAFNLAKKVLSFSNFEGRAIITLLDQDTEISSEVYLALEREMKDLPRKCVVGAKFADRNFVGNTVERKTVDCLPTSTATMWLEDFLIADAHNEDFPVDLADFVWCWKNAASNQFCFTRLEHVLVKQSLGLKRFYLLGREISLPSPFRHEHQMRAVRRLWTLNYVSKITKIKFTLKALLKLLVYPIIFRDGRERFLYMARGLICR